MPVIGGYPTLELTTDEDTPISSTIPATDPDGNNVFINGIDPIEDLGTLVQDAVDPLGITYTPAQDFNGIEQFKVTVSDDGVPQASDTVLVVITVLPINDAPVIAAGDTIRVTVNEDEISQICVDVTDVDDGDIVTITAINPSDANGTYTLDPSGSLCFDFEPQPDFNGVSYASITVIDDGTPPLDDAAIIEITIANVNDPPVIVENGVLR